MIVFVSVRAVPLCLQGTGIALGATGLLTVVTMSWINFVLDSDFKWLLLVPAIAWLLALVSYGAANSSAHAIVAVAQTKVDAPT